MQETLKSALDAYLRDSLADHAIITRPWGAGKIYYWKHAAVFQIKRLDVEGQRRWRTAYVLLFGVATAEVLHASVFFALYPVIAGRVAELDFCRASGA